MKKLLYLLPMLAWLSLIFDFSSQSYSQQSIIPYLQGKIPEQRLQQVVPNITIRYNHSQIHAKSDPYHFVEFLFRKGAHLFMYAMLGLFAMLALLPWIRRILVRIPLALVVVAVFASLDEWNQSFSGERTPTILDVFVDLSGAGIGLALLLLVRFFLLRIKHRRRIGSAR